MDRGVADHAAGAHLIGRRLELGLHEGEEPAPITEQLHDGGQDHADAGERDVADGEVEGAGEPLRGHVDDVGALEQRDPRVAAQAPGELRAPDVHRDDAGRAALEEAVGEATGRAPDIDACEARGVHAERVERTRELEPAAADVRDPPLHMDRGAGLDARGRRLEPLPAA